MRDGILAFWSWWVEARSDLEHAARGRDASDELAARIAERVAAIHAELEWELGPGAAKAHSLCVTAAGKPEAREAAARWLIAAPDDPGWEFHRARPAVPSAHTALALGSGRLSVADVRFRLEEHPDDDLVDVTVDERSLRSLAPGDRPIAMFLVLDHLLGEENVERFVGEIDMRPLRWRTEPPEALIAAVERLARTRAARHAAGEDRAAILQGSFEGKPGVILANTSIRRVDHPLLSAHALVELELADATELGLTTREEADVLNAQQDDLEATLGDDGILAARETRDSRRIIHLYLDPESTASARVREWCSACHPRRASVTITHEPDWSSVTIFGLR